MVFNRTEELNNNFNPDTNLIGIRIPDHDFLRQALDVVIKFFFTIVMFSVGVEKWCSF